MGPTDNFVAILMVFIAMMSFDFVFVLHMLNKVMGITDFLCQQFQKKSIDIVTALNHISTTKTMLQDLRKVGWDKLFENVVSFCQLHDIDVPDMHAHYRMGTGRFHQ